MPELPDVEGFRRFFDRYGTGKRVEQVNAEPDVLRNTTPQGLGRALSGNRLQKPERHGKWLVCPAGQASLVLHFGMTGHLVWSGDEPDHHKHDRLTLTLEDGELLNEVELTTSLIVAASESEGQLSQAAIDAILGVKPAVPEVSDSSQGRDR
ncbi:MAG: hypothetical protein KY393_06690 [Actinobacteria bacterium]|nr:hypothetical protein [Actinomycetota bacterium]